MHLVHTYTILSIHLHLFARSLLPVTAVTTVGVSIYYPLPGIYHLLGIYHINSIILCPPPLPMAEIHIPPAMRPLLCPWR